MAIPHEMAAYLEDVVHLLRIVLGDALVGVYVVGSGALCDFDPVSSDLDVAVVVETGLTSREQSSLVAVLGHDARPCPARKLELVVFPRRSVAVEPPTLEWDLNLNTGSAEHSVSYDPSSKPSHWFVLDACVAREAGTVLWGPPREEVFARIERPRILRALAESIRWHRRHDEEGVSSVLNACRAWRFVVEGAWSSKVSAGRWAERRTSERSVIGRALERRQNRSQLSLDREAVLRFLGEVEWRIGSHVGMIRER